MANEDNLIPFNSDQSREEAVKNGKKGGIASGKARRKKTNLKRLMQDALLLDLPESKLKRQLEEMGIDTSMADGLVISVLTNAISKGNVQAFELIQKTIGEDTTLQDRREQKARIEKMQAETKRIEEANARSTGESGAELAQMQATAIADMINTPSAERTLQDFLVPKEVNAKDGDDEGDSDG